MQTCHRCPPWVPSLRTDSTEPRVEAPEYIGASDKQTASGGVAKHHQDVKNGAQSLNPAFRFRVVTPLKTFGCETHPRVRSSPTILEIQVGMAKQSRKPPRRVLPLVATAAIQTLENSSQGNIGNRTQEYFDVCGC